MLPSYCVSFQAWRFQSTQESLRLTTAFSSNQSISVEQSHSNCTSLADPWWIYMFGRYPQHHKVERTYPRTPVIHNCSEWRLHSLVYYMMLVTGTRGRQRLQAQLTIIATPILAFSEDPIWGRHTQKPQGHWHGIPLASLWSPLEITTFSQARNVFCLRISQFCLPFSLHW